MKTNQEATMSVQEKVKKSDYEERHFFEDDEDEGAQDNKYLTFSISKEVYGINISQIVEIIEIQKVTEVPDMPKFVKGIINLRGKVIPIIDLRLRFSMDERTYDDRTCIVIVTVRNSSIGFIVDTVLEVVDIAENMIEPAPQFKSQSGYERYITGIGKVGENVKILLDAEKIVHQEELVKISEAV
jgi:purine-binding chemotaxis protein CheW